MTRDRNYGKSTWNGKDFSVIDTGGYVSNSDDIFEEEINKQVLLAMEEADVILFMVDAEIGVTDLDQNFARLLRNIDKPIYLVANKVDNQDRMYEHRNFTVWGFPAICSASPLSAVRVQVTCWTRWCPTSGKTPWKIRTTCPASLS